MISTVLSEGVLMDITLMQPGQERPAIDLVKAVFDRFVAPEFSQQGIAEFYKYANEDSLSRRTGVDHFTILALERHRILGILEIKDFCHVSMFFVRSNHQKKGIGRELLKDAVRRIQKKRNDLSELTVNASPNAVAAYAKFGFTSKSGEQCTNGIRFVPMVLKTDYERV